MLATQPELYDCFVEAGGPSLMLTLLSHENSDILGATVNLLQVIFPLEFYSRLGLISRESTVAGTD